MPLENSGKVLLEIRFLRKKIRLIFDDESLEISPSSYTDFYLYPNKNLTILELSKIRTASELLKFENYAFALVGKGLYTRKQVMDKLYAREAKRWVVETIIEKLNSSGLINDEEFLKERIAYGHERGEGMHHIISDLRLKGIGDDQIKSEYFPVELEVSKAQNHLVSLQRKYVGKSTRGKKQAIIKWLIDHGFEMSTINQVMGQIEKNDQNTEKIYLRKELVIAKRKYSHKFKGNALKQHLIQYLMQKGYNYQDISNVLGEPLDEMD